MIRIYKGSIKNEVDEVAIQQEISSYLQLDNINFLIGAGCSSNIVDGVEQGIPGMKKLYDDFFTDHDDFSAAGLELKDKFDCNLEKMLEALGAIQVANGIVEIDKEIDKKITLVQTFIREKIIAGLHGKEVLSIYKDFYKKMISESRKAPINIFTTNYDLYNEQALDFLGFPYNNGFTGTYKRKFNPASYKYAYVEDMNLSKEVWERVPNFFNLYKIHGSISWYGFLLGISSQRPSELSKTVVSQCSNFIIHRVQNPDDLKYISSMVPYINNNMIERLTYLQTGNALVFGTAINIPTLTKFEQANPSTDSENAKITEKWYIQ